MIEPMRALVLVVVCAGCPGSPESPAPRAPELVVTPPVAPTPWWSKGDAACPALEMVVPGAAPGATTHEGHLHRTPTDIYCEVAGTPYGPATRLYPDGRPAETGTIVSGKRVGAWTAFHPDGAVAAFGEYNGVGTQDGTWSTWYASKRPRDRGTWFNGAKVGLWQEWDDGGDPSRDPDRFVEYDSKSRPVMHGVYRDGTPLEALPVCAFGIAYPGCRLIPLVELGFREAPNEPTPTRGKKGSATFELGGLVNLTPHNSLGMTYGWVIDGTYPATQLELRYRYWLLRWMAFEGGVGRLSGRDGAPDGTEFRIAVVGADIGSLTFTFERHTLPGGDESQALFGVRFGLPTLAGAALVLSSK
jgi:hypothetical protein